MLTLEKENKAIKNIKLRDIRNLFEKEEEELRVSNLKKIKQLKI